MNNQRSWSTIQNELNGLLRSEEFEDFVPLLELIQRAADARYYEPDLVGELLSITKQLQRYRGPGRDFHAMLDQATSGPSRLKQPEWAVGGDVVQPGRDANQVIVQMLEMVQPEMKQDKLSASVSIPIVLVVMNHREAQELYSERVFDSYHPELSENFRRLQGQLAESGETDWIRRYREQVEDFRPFVDVSNTIEQLINSVFRRVGDSRKTLIPEFFDIHTLNNENHRKALWRLRNEGCVVILDVVSVHHPEIQYKFRRSLLDAYPNTFVAKIAPVRDAISFIKQMNMVVEKFADLEFFRRESLDFDEKCSRTRNPMEFSRWLATYVKKIIPEEDKKQRRGPRHYEFTSM